MAQVIVVGGENPVFIRDKVIEIREKFSQEATNFYYSDDLDVSQFLSELYSFSLFAEKRLLILKNAENISSTLEKSLLSYFENPSKAILLLLQYQTKISQKIKSAAAKNKIIVYDFKKPWPQDLKDYARRTLQNLGIQADFSVLEMLLEFAGADISELSGMLEKLFVFLGERKILREDDVFAVVDRAQNSSIFQFLEAIFDHRGSFALTALSDLIYAGNSLHAINAMFYRASKIMWAVKTIKSKEVPSNLSISAYEWKKYQSFSAKNSLRFLSECLMRVRKIEIATKTNGEALAQIVFEEFLCQLD